MTNDSSRSRSKRKENQKGLSSKRSKRQSKTTQKSTSQSSKRKSKQKASNIINKQSVKEEDTKKSKGNPTKRVGSNKKSLKNGKSTPEKTERGSSITVIESTSTRHKIVMKEMQGMKSPNIRSQITKNSVDHKIDLSEVKSMERKRYKTADFIDSSREDVTSNQIKNVSSNKYVETSPSKSNFQLRPVSLKMRSVEKKRLAHQRRRLFSDSDAIASNESIKRAAIVIRRLRNSKSESESFTPSELPTREQTPFTRLRSSRNDEILKDGTGSSVKNVQCLAPVSERSSLRTTESTDSKRNSATMTNKRLRLSNSRGGGPHLIETAGNKFQMSRKRVARRIGGNMFVASRHSKKLENDTRVNEVRKLHEDEGVFHLLHSLPAKRQKTQTRLFNVQHVEVKRRRYSGGGSSSSKYDCNGVLLHKLPGVENGKSSCGIYERSFDEDDGESTAINGDSDDDYIKIPPVSPLVLSPVRGEMQQFIQSLAPLHSSRSEASERGPTSEVGGSHHSHVFVSSPNINSNVSKAKKALLQQDQENSSPQISNGRGGSSTKASSALPALTTYHVDIQSNRMHPTAHLEHWVVRGTNENLHNGDLKETEDKQSLRKSPKVVSKEGQSELEDKRNKKTTTAVITTPSGKRFRLTSESSGDGSQSRTVLVLQQQKSSSPSAQSPVNGSATSEAACPFDPSQTCLKQLNSGNVSPHEEGISRGFIVTPPPEENGSKNIQKLPSLVLNKSDKEAIRKAGVECTGISTDEAYIAKMFSSSSSSTSSISMSKSLSNGPSIHSNSHLPQFKDIRLRAYRTSPPGDEMEHRILEILMDPTSSSIRNTFNVNMISEIVDVFNNVSAECSNGGKSTAANGVTKYRQTVILSALNSSSVFSHGVDLTLLSNVTSADKQKRCSSALANAVKKLCLALLASPCLTVACVNGDAFGLGVAILPLFDLSYACHGSKFQTHYSRLGQLPEAFLSESISDRRLKSCLLLDKQFTASQAKEFGLLSDVFHLEKPNFALVEYVVSNHLSVNCRPSPMHISTFRRSVKRRVLSVANSETEELMKCWNSATFASDCKNYLSSTNQSRRSAIVFQ